MTAYKANCADEDMWVICSSCGEIACGDCEHCERPQCEEICDGCGEHTCYKYGYDLPEVTADDLRPHLAAFLLAALESAREADLSADAASWSPADASEPATPEIQDGRRPAMTYANWQRSQLIDLGATDRDQWYWQCPTTGCKVWAGPYGDPIEAKQAGFEHVYCCEKTDYFCRGRQS